MKTVLLSLALVVILGVGCSAKVETAIEDLGKKPGNVDGDTGQSQNPGGQTNQQEEGKPAAAYEGTWTSECSVVGEQNQQASMKGTHILSGDRMYSHVQVFVDTECKTLAGENKMWAIIKVGETHPQTGITPIDITTTENGVQKTVYSVFLLKGDQVWVSDKDSEDPATRPQEVNLNVAYKKQAVNQAIPAQN